MPTTSGSCAGRRRRPWRRGAESRGGWGSTAVTHIRHPGKGCESLGFRLGAGRGLVRKTSLKALKDKVRSRTIRSRGDSLERIIADLNPVLRGWFGYFQHATPAL